MPGGTLILGLGNPILSDDRIGLLVARRLGELLPGVDVEEASIAGMAMLDIISGYGRLVVVDSVMTGKGQPGDLYRMSLEDLGPAVPVVSPHGAGLASTIEAGRVMGYDLPGEIEIYAVEIENDTEFGETLSPAVEARLPDIVGEIIERSFPQRPE
jgi:hydrogenase maturation protease